MPHETMACWPPQVSQVGALVHRSGAVDSVIVGTSTGLMLPDIGRLRAAQRICIVEVSCDSLLKVRRSQINCQLFQVFNNFGCDARFNIRNGFETENKFVSIHKCYVILQK